MNQSSLQLEHYTFTEVEVKCCIDPDNSSEEFSSARVEIEQMNFEIQQIGDVSEKNRGIVLRVKVNTLDGELCKSLKYKFSMEAMAKISMRPDSTIDVSRVEKTLVINGVNLIYGIMREKLNTITSTMLWGQLLLPLATFDGIAKTAATKVEAPAPTKSKNSAV